MVIFNLSTQITNPQNYSSKGRTMSWWWWCVRSWRRWSGIVLSNMDDSLVFAWRHHEFSMQHLESFIFLGISSDFVFIPIGVAYTVLVVRVLMQKTRAWTLLCNLYYPFIVYNSNKNFHLERIGNTRGDLFYLATPSCLIRALTIND